MFIDLAPGRLVEPLSGRAWNSREIVARVIARMQRLQSEGLGHGDRVFVLYGNKLEFFVDVLAAWHSGASLVPIDSRLTSFEIENLARAVEPRLLLVDSSAGAAALSGLTVLGVRVLDTTAWDIAGDSHPTAGRIRSHAQLDNEALMLFTSGSTGVPKGVVHTHRSLRARWIALKDALGLAAFRQTLCLLPTHFGHGLICNSLFPWLAGQDLFIAPPFSTECLMRLGWLIDEHKITFLSSVPSMWGLALKASKPPAARSLRRVHCGSAPLSSLLWRQIQEWRVQKKFLTPTASPKPVVGWPGLRWGTSCRRMV